MSFTNGSPFAWAFGISLAIHLSIIGIINFDDEYLEEEKEKQFINIALTQEEQVKTINRDSLEPLTNRESLEHLEYDQIIPTAPILPIPQEHLRLEKNLEPRPTLNDVAQLPDLPKPLPTQAAQLEEAVRLQELKNIKHLSKETSVTTLPPIEPQKLAAKPPQQNFPPRLTSKNSLDIIPVTQPANLTQTPTNIPDLPQPPDKIPVLAPPQHSQAIKTDLVELKSTDQPLLSAPPLSLPPSLTPTEPRNSEEEIESSLDKNNGVINAATNKYAESLHGTLNKRAQRKYPKKAIQNCIQGTVKVQVQISPTGEQLSYEITNSTEAPLILQRAAQKLLDGRKDYSEFSRDVSSEPVTFQVNLIYRLPHCP